MKNPSIFIEPLERSVFVAFESDDHQKALLHYANINDAIKQFVSLAEALRNRKPIEDMSETDITAMIDGISEEISTSSNNLIRMKWIRSTANYHVYGYCGHTDDLAAENLRRMGITKIHRSEFPSSPSEFISFQLKESAPVSQENQNA